MASRKTEKILSLSLFFFSLFFVAKKLHFDREVVFLYETLNLVRGKKRRKRRKREREKRRKERVRERERERGLCPLRCTFCVKKTLLLLRRRTKRLVFAFDLPLFENTRERERERERESRLKLVRAL